MCRNGRFDVQIMLPVCRSESGDREKRSDFLLHLRSSLPLGSSRPIPVYSRDLISACFEKVSTHSHYANFFDYVRYAGVIGFIFHVFQLQSIRVYTTKLDMLWQVYDMLWQVYDEVSTKIRLKTESPLI